MTTKTSAKLTPLMTQYYSLKNKHKDAVLLFRVGDFYETFGEDAILVSKVLGIVLTSRNNGGSDIELAGFPYHSMDTYLPKLVKAGYRVAVCEQLEKPSKEKKIVKRGVTEIVTPGLATDDKLLNKNTNNWLCAYFKESDSLIGLAFLDISTGEFLIDQGSPYYCEKIIESFNPAEILFAAHQKSDIENITKGNASTFKMDDWIFSIDFAREKLLDHFGTVSLKGYGIDDYFAAQIAGGALLQYLFITENKDNSHINNIQRIDHDNIVWLDKFTIKNLELVRSIGENGMSLIDILDLTQSPMGGRLLKQWTLMPLKNIKSLKKRHDIVEYLFKNEQLRKNITDCLKSVGDLERLAAKIASRKINPRELFQLGKSLDSLIPLKKALQDSQEPYLIQYAEMLDCLDAVIERIESTLIPDPPVNLNKGKVITAGCNEELDELNYLITNSQNALLEIQQREAESTGITNLKIGFNNVFGYYLEVTNKYKHKDLIPSTWTRKQTLSNAERYISEELKILEDKILTAEDKISILEDRIYNELVDFCLPYINTIQQNCKVLAECDCLSSFANVAIKYDYIRPDLNNSFTINIKNGRHPVIERHLVIGEQYVPNDVFLDKDSQQILMITGPNMSGKSALLRQTALICLMAQMGSFVPASSAEIGLIDKIFTRVGASDNISSGESTFMVEMNETSSILNNITDRSLVLLDEIGRGTSTYDGISIAWSIAEFLHENPYAKPKTLFATHYHELNQLAEIFPNIKNFHVATKELGSRIVFLRKLVEGGSEHSFGIHVAKMAGMPKVIVQRADEILKQMETKSLGENKNTIKKTLSNISPPVQMSIFQTSDPKSELIRKEIETMDLQGMTPIDCMMKIYAWKKSFEE